MAGPGRRTGRILLVSVDLAVAVGAPLWNYYFTRDDIPLQAGAAVIAVTTFTSVWLIQRSRAYGNPTTDSMRDAIAASFVVTYLVMVAWSAFFNYAVNVDQGRQAVLAPLTQTLISNFTILTGLVVGFYFGTDAVKQVALARQPKTSNESREDISDEVSPPRDDTGSAPCTE